MYMLLHKNEVLVVHFVEEQIIQLVPSLLMPIPAMVFV